MSATITTNEDLSIRLAKLEAQSFKATSRKDVMAAVQDAIREAENSAAISQVNSSALVEGLRNLLVTTDTDQIQIALTQILERERHLILANVARQLGSSSGFADLMNDHIRDQIATAIRAQIGSAIEAALGLSTLPVTTAAALIKSGPFMRSLASSSTLHDALTERHREWVGGQTFRFNVQPA